MGASGVAGAIISVFFARIVKNIKANVRLVGVFFYVIAFSLFAIRLSEPPFIMGINLMLILGIIAAIFNGLATGMLIPFFISLISFKSKKKNLSKNMAIGSIVIFSGQFLSPLIDAFLENLLNLHHPRDAFLIAACIAIFLFIYNLRLKIKIK